MGLFYVEPNTDIFLLPLLPYLIAVGSFPGQLKEYVDKYKICYIVLCEIQSTRYNYNLFVEVILKCSVIF